MAGAVIADKDEESAHPAVIAPVENGETDWLNEVTPMLVNTTILKGLAVQATDGEIGVVEQFYFDDETWAIRYVIVDTGGWLGGRRVLVSPISVLRADWKARRVDVALSMKQVEFSPDINTHEPVSRQHEVAYLGYYGYPGYWGGPYLWGPAFYPAGLALQANIGTEILADRIEGASKDSHLRSSEAVTGYHLEASDGEIGHVSSFLVDDEVWAIRYLEVATRNWWPGNKVLSSPSWVERVSWTDSKVYVGLSRKSIRNGPEYTEGTAITREYENLLYLHYGRPTYWPAKMGPDSSSFLTSVQGSKEL
jgi:hypothetical protein